MQESLKSATTLMSNSPALTETVKLTSAYSSQITTPLSIANEIRSSMSIANSIPSLPQTALNTGVFDAVSQLGKAIATSYMASEALSNAMTTFVNQMMESQREMISNLVNISNNLMKSLVNWGGLTDNFLFMKIADEIGFPIYLDNGTELQEKLLDSYRRNDYKCNVPEMKEIILDYYNDDYVTRVLNHIRNVGVFKEERVKILAEGIELYQMGWQAGAGSIFALQVSGMIGDIYEEMCKYHKYTKQEKLELLTTFEQKCLVDSEKSELLQILCAQDGGAMVWYHVAEYFLDVVYSSKNKHIDTKPQRHPMCHGNQLNYNTPEMNLQWILRMDILSELAYRVKEMNV